MIASNIGYRFLDIYNEREGTSFSIKELFEKVFVPQFFGYPKYMRSGGNAPLENPKFKKGRRPSDAERMERIQKTVAKIDSDPMGASGIGYPSGDVLATTSGQVTSTILPISSDNVYASWVGGGFGVGVKGGYSLYLNHPDILWDLYEGWSYYRGYLEEWPDLRPNQIDTWNGQWLAHRYNPRKFYAEAPLANFDPFDVKLGVKELKTQSWVKVIFGLARKFPASSLTAYAFSLGQTNKTLGFIPLALPKIRKLIQLYKVLFGGHQYFEHAEIIEEIFAEKNGFQLACERGAIGTSALEPKFIRDLTYKHNPKIKYNPEDTYQIVSFQTYIIWIIAMLDKKELLPFSQQIAGSLLAYGQSGTRGKTTQKRAVEKLMESKSADAFLQELLPIVVNASAEQAVLFQELIAYVHDFSHEHFKRFLVLLKLAYIIQEKQT
ncbi:MAG: hypothetical protein AAF135_23170 [Bacteroidota bacterium]